MLLKASGGGGSEDKAKRSSSGAAATGTTTTLSSSNGKAFRNGTKMAVSSSGSGSVPTNVPRNIHRKAIRTASSKRFPGKAMSGKLHTVNRMGPGKIMKNPGKRLLQRPNPPVCDNSNDSGLGFDNQELSGGAAAAQYHSQLANVHHRANGTSLLTTSHTGGGAAAAAAGGMVARMGGAGAGVLVPSATTTSTSSLDMNSLVCHNSCSNGGGAGGQQPAVAATSSSSVAAHERHMMTLLDLNGVGAGGGGRVGGGSSEELLKRRKMATKVLMDSDDACSSDAFIFAQQQKQQQQFLQDVVLAGSGPASGVNEILSSPGKSCGPRPAVRRQAGNQVNMQQQGGTGLSKNGRYQLQILAQPEQQHRARYQTEGSRGAVKDRSGNNFPIVRLQGSDKPAVLEVFIGTDVGRVAPHMFYQACKVSGKNSTPCVEKKVEGTMIIELELKPEQEMMVTCDCVGILKERNVDVEHRFPDQSTQRSKKKSTRCRMVFRATITHEDGTTEQLQVCSQPIICTQPPGVPEICKKSLIGCPVLGGFELFIIGKNFAKDTKIVFQSQKITGEVVWQEVVVPDKEYLQQTHLICAIPAYVDVHIRDPVTVQLYAMANGRKSEYHNFVYTPKEDRYSAIPSYSLQSHVAEDLQCLNLKPTTTPTEMLAQSPTATMTSAQVQAAVEQQQSQAMWGGLQDATDCGMMPPPNSTMSLNIRRSSSGGGGGLPMGVVSTDQLSPSSSSTCSSNCSLKVECHDESSQGSIGEMSVELLMHSNGGGPSGGGVVVDCSSSSSQLMIQADSLAVVAAAVKQEELAVAQQMAAAVAHQHHNMIMSGHHMGGPGVAAGGGQVSGANDAPIRFTDQQLTTISQAINATTTNPATSSVMDVGGMQQHMDTQQQLNRGSPGGGGGGLGRMEAVNLVNCGGALSSDIILNSQNAILSASPGSSGSSSVSSSPGASMGPMDHSSISSDVILNPQVTPSLLCDQLSGGGGPVVVAVASAVPSMVVDPLMGLSAPVVSTASSGGAVEVNGGGLLVDPMMAAPAVVDTMLGSSPGAQSPQSPNSQGGAATTAEVVQNVQNMILNAAAEILVSQQTTISTESMQAIISLNNAASMLNDQQQGQSPPGGNELVYQNSPPVVVGAEDPSLALMVGRRNSNIMSEAGGQVVVGPGDIHMRTVHEEIGHMGGSTIPIANVGEGIISTGMVVVNNLLAVQQQQQPGGGVAQDVTQGAGQVSIISSSGGGAPMETNVVPVTTNALMVALNGPMIVTGSNQVGGVVGNELKATNVMVVQQQQQQQQQQPPATIPQEIATMSENDLISYINPNCFEQEFQNI